MKLKLSKVSDYFAIIILAAGLITIAIAIFIIGFEITTDLLR